MRKEREIERAIPHSETLCLRKEELRAKARNKKVKNYATEMKALEIER